MMPAAWYLDPTEPTRRRYWDGQRWTDHYAEVNPHEKITGLTPPVARTYLLQTLAQQGAQVTGQTDTSIVGVVPTRTGPNLLVVLILLLFFIIPGIIYALIGHRSVTVPFTIAITPSGDGTVVLPSGSGAAFRAASVAVAALPDRVQAHSPPPELEQADTDRTPLPPSDGSAS